MAPRKNQPKKGLTLVEKEMASNGKELQTEEKELASEPLASWDEGISDDEGR
jgi:hypothetical protein